MNDPMTTIREHGVTRLARQLGVRQSAVSNWIRRKQVPAERCPAVEAATRRAVTCEQLRPDLTWHRSPHGTVTGYTVPVAVMHGAAATR